jgi:uncharacterized membrane protein YsdA (DUF1294 family)
VLGAFGVALLLAFLIAPLPFWIPAAYILMSVVCFATYGADKAAARAGRRRRSEQTLVALGLIGGWPGALVAQQVFRHKTRKRSFRRAFWLTVVINTAVLAGLVYVAVATPEAMDFPFLAQIGSA